MLGLHYNLYFLLHCIKGDSRVNQTPMLALWQSVFLRMHNKIAEEMSKIHNTWNDDKIFNNARKLNQAIYQHILFHEWVPLMLGNINSSRFPYCSCNNTS